MRLHPDVNGGGVEATKRFQSVVRAYQVLRDGTRCSSAARCPDSAAEKSREKYVTTGRVPL